MKTSFNPKKMILCQIYKWRINCRIDDNLSPGRLTAGHLRHCQQCESYYRQQSRVAQLLMSGQPAKVISADLSRQRIIQSIRDLERVEKSSRARPSLSFLRPAFAVLAALLVTGGLILSMTLLKQPETQEAQQDLPQELPSMLQVSERLRSHLLYNEIKNHYSLEKELISLSQDLLATADYFLSYTDRIPKPYLPPEFRSRSDNH